MKAIDVMTRNDNAAPEAAVPIVINARIDIYLKQIGDPASRFAETVRRAEAYLAPGADCIFPFAVTDADTSGRLTWAIQAPINIVGRAGTPDLATLERLGVKRVSTASSLTMMAIDGTGASQARKLGEQRLHLLNAWEARRFPRWQIRMITGSRGCNRRQPLTLNLFRGVWSE